MDVGSPEKGQDTPNGFLFKRSSNIRLVLLLILLLIFGFWFVSLPVLILLLLIPPSRRFLITKFKFYRSTVELILSHHPLRLGDECTINFCRRLKMKQKTQVSGKLIFEIFCVERVQYTKGTQTETEHYTIWRSSEFVKDVPVGVSELLLEKAFEIPRHLPPSFEGKHNQIRWVMSIKQNIPKIAEQACSEFTIIVDPVVVK